MREPIVTVIITSFNHGAYIGEAIASVQAQDYRAIQLVVVDDGSTDNTRALVTAIPGVEYHYQNNQGLAAARNAGIAFAKGDYLVFLDADDWLLPDAVSVNLGFLRQHPELAFVAGAHEFYFSEEKRYQPVQHQVEGDYYCRLLEGNFIGMHAAVMYHRWVFKEFRFDSRFSTCEDFDLYLRVVRKYPMLYHTRILAVYRIHSTNMSGNAIAMLTGALQAYARQKPVLRTAEERASMARGKRFFTDYYMEQLEKQLYIQLFHAHQPVKLSDLLFLQQRHPRIFHRFLDNSLQFLQEHPQSLEVKGWRRFLPLSMVWKLLLRSS
jgi:glycosyltransferase involved in cell wall biosynthesis